MAELLCVVEGVYEHALTRGRRYKLIDVDHDKQQYRIRGDNGRVRWYPEYCFDEADRSLLELVDFQIDERTVSPDGKLIEAEVTVELSNGERRWCLFLTPAALERFGEWLEMINGRFLYDNRHLIFAQDLSEEAIGMMLDFLDREDHLLECTILLKGMDGIESE